MLKKQDMQGYVLLEALVALLIFSLGLLGMIGFQAAASKISTDSRFRTEAAMLADELMTKMAASDVSKVQSEFGATGTKFVEWKTKRLEGGSRLPNPEVTLQFSAGATSQVLRADLTIKWTMPGAGTGANAREVQGVYTTRALLF